MGVGTAVIGVHVAMVCSDWLCYAHGYGGYG